MLVETTPDAAPAARSGTLIDHPAEASETGPETGAAAPGAAALAELRAAGLVDCEAVGDPARLAGETAALDALCARIAGPVYRLAPFRYAFAARPSGRDGPDARPDAPADVLAAALDAALGPGAVRLGRVAPEPVYAPAAPAANAFFLRAREAPAGDPAASPAPDAAPTGPGGADDRRPSEAATETAARIEAGIAAVLARLDAQTSTLAALAALVAGSERPAAAQAHGSPASPG
jgi:hypothetical protein